MLIPQPTRSPPTYIERRLLDGEDLLAWAQAQGFEHRLPLDELYITVALARCSPDSDPILAELSELAICGGERCLVHLAHDVIALAFAAPELEVRRQELQQAGAELREPFRPHVTFAFDPSVDIYTVAPFTGDLRFGPEIVRPDRFASLF